MKIISSMLFVLLSASLFGCETFMQDQGTMAEIASANQKVKISKEARDFCENQPMVGIQKGFTALLRLKRNELDSAEGQLEFSTYSKLSQELEGYNVEYELTNQQMVIACRQHAVCIINNSTSGMCRDAEEKYNAKLDKASELLVRLKGLEVTK